MSPRRTVLPDQMPLSWEVDESAPRYSAADLARALGNHPPTPEQAAVIEAPLGPEVVVAGAGSGKTETMAARVVWLVANGLVAPEQVLGLTFTRKAARELAARIRRRLQQLRARGHLGPAGPYDDSTPGDVSVATYDAYAQRIVAEHALRLGREPGTRLVTPAIAWQYATRVVETYDGPMDFVDYAFSTVVDAVLSLHGEMAGHLVTPAQLEDFTQRLIARVKEKPKVARTKGQLHAEVEGALRRQVARVQLLPIVEAFVAEKQRREAVDFADQAALAAQLAEEFPEVGERERDRYSVVLLDEYQDTSHAQLAMLRGLYGGKTAHPIVAVGDPCQSIYGWRGASAATLVAFGEQFRSGTGEAAPTRSLSTSFRNGASVLAVANVLAEPLRSGGLVVPELASHPSTGAGEVLASLHLTVDDEARDVAARINELWTADAPLRSAGGVGRTVAVLVRKRAQIDRIARSLRGYGLPVEVVGVGGLLATPAVTDVVATLRVLSDPSRGDALMRLLTGARWRIGPRDLDGLGRWARRLAAARAAGQPAEAAPEIAVDTSGERRRISADDIDQRSIIDALDALPQEGWFSPAGRRRMTALADELRTLRSRAAQPLVDLVADVVRTLGLDVEVAARTGDVTTSRADLDAFLDVAVGFADSGEGATLTAFLAFLDAADEEERGLEPGQVEIDDERIQVLTVHGAKGLEWDVVFVPGMVEGVLPAARAKDKAWLSDVGALPFPLRGDAAVLPELDVSGAADQGDVKAAFEQFMEDCGERARLEERRLAYVAVTRARQLLICSGYRWDETTKPREPGEYLQEIAAVCAAGAGSLPVWHGTVDVEGGNPVTAEPPSHAWPYDPLDDKRRTEIRAGANLVGLSLAALDSPAPMPQPVLEASYEWHRDVDLLLSERARRAARDEVLVELPERLSVSQLVSLRRDPSALARVIRRPVPRPPNPLARRGTAFHAWLESRFGRPQLLDVDELPGSADEQAEVDSDLEVLQNAFLASEWAEQQPVEVEVPFELVVAGVVVRGRADAVFPREEDGGEGIEVVDWKTGRVPRDPDELAVTSVQLAAYRLAWSQLTGLPLEQVRAAFHYVRQNTTIRPVDLLDREGLEALVTSVPLAP
ncbi:UvrD-helicase domain-containing protein [Tenggerimyces flavus]|uniref:DNA 3'-5' helicase n=1 Tax=Tenggerimyces flavus TaxID=1708749 RepID=A0ABV7YE04_9ACTN|nr:UvrD-helicase domain-containing protein [Tenggerimyces flavus]MBM7786079.1 DNA helicase-2/ATP-dependent DNA helicase PcrA [Tenggerimyces flavus]